MTGFLKSALRRGVAVAMVAAGATLAGWAAYHWGGASGSGVAEADKPIIAQLYASSDAFDSHRIEIYGLVVDAAADGRSFMLQDVSQMPLEVRKSDGPAVLVGDQLLVQGIFRANRGRPFLEARTATPTKVLGGGGCC